MKINIAVGSFGSQVMGQKAASQSNCKILYNVILQERSALSSLFFACR